MLSPINSGCTAVPTSSWARHVLPSQWYPFDAWSQKRRAGAFVELTVRHSVPDIRELVTSRRIGAGEPIKCFGLLSNVPVCDGACMQVTS